MKTKIDFSTPSNTIIFHVDKICVNGEKLCLSFKEAFMDLDKVSELVFELENKVFVFKKFGGGRKIR